MTSMFYATIVIIILFIIFCLYDVACIMIHTKSTTGFKELLTEAATSNSMALLEQDTKLVVVTLWTLLTIIFLMIKLSSR